MNVQNERCHKRINLLHIPSDTAKELYFYAEWTGHFLCKPDFYINRSGLESYLLIYTRAGGGTLNYIGKIFDLTAGSIALIDCRLAHEYYPVSDEWEFKYVHFNGSNIKKLYEKICEGGKVCFGGFDGADMLFDRIRDCASGNGSEEECSELIYRILMGIASEKEKLCGDWLKSTVAFISDNYSSPITVEELAKRAHLSRTYFSVEFKKRVGISPREYIEGYRIEIAKRLLETSELTVTDIAQRCGFTDSATFIRTFGRVCGTSPLKYRRF